MGTTNVVQSPSSLQHLEEQTVEERAASCFEALYVHWSRALTMTLVLHDEVLWFISWHAKHIKPQLSALFFSHMPEFVVLHIKSNTVCLCNMTDDLFKCCLWWQKTVLHSLKKIMAAHSICFKVYVFFTFGLFSELYSQQGSVFVSCDGFWATEWMFTNCPVSWLTVSQYHFPC